MDQRATISEPLTERSISRRHLIMGGALLGTAAIAEALVPRKRVDLLGKGKLDTLIPDKIGAWEFYSKSGLVVPPADQLSEMLYSQLLTRVYVAPNRSTIMLLVAQSPGQDGVLQVHRPEVCYPFGGYTLSNSQVHMIDVPGTASVPTRAFTATGPDRIEQLLYWTRIGHRLPVTWAQQRLAVASANLQGEIPDAMLVRISTLAPDQSALADLDAFAKALIGAVPRAARPILIGS